MIWGVDVASMLLGGVAAGMVLFIVSVGLSVTMGLMGFVNLAHGGFAMLGGYAVVLAMKLGGLGFLPALGVAFVAIALVSVVFERLLYGAFVGAVAYMVLAHFLAKIYPTAWQLGLGLLLVVIALFARNGILGLGAAVARRLTRRAGA